MKNMIYILIALCTGCIINTGCENISTHPISKPDGKLYETRLEGKWKFAEDSNSHNFYTVTKGYTSDHYHIKFWDRGGKNPTYEAEAYLSRVDENLFINLPCLNEDKSELGYLLLRLLKVDNYYDTITAAIIDDAALTKKSSIRDVYKHVKTRMNDSRFYSDTIHLYKVQP